MATSRPRFTQGLSIGPDYPLAPDPVYNGDPPPGEDPIPIDGRRQDPVHRWLTTRIDGQLETRAQQAEESTEDAVTVRASRATIRRALAEPREEDVEDARTVRMRRMPVSFIGESVFDPETQVDARAHATRWREQAPVDEIDPLSDGITGSIEPPEPPRHVAAPTPEPPLTPVDEPESISVRTMLLSLAFGAGLGVLAVAIGAAIRYLLLA